MAPKPDDQWRDSAACRGMPANMFLPTRGQPTEPAKKVCASCPVSKQCYQFAIDNNERFGIWGGVATEARLDRVETATGTRRRKPGPHAATVRSAELAERARRLRRYGWPVSEIAMYLKVSTRQIFRLFENEAS